MFEHGKESVLVLTECYGRKTLFTLFLKPVWDDGQRPVNLVELQHGRSYAITGLSHDKSLVCTCGVV